MHLDTVLCLSDVFGLDDADLVHLGIGDKTPGVQGQSCAGDLHGSGTVSKTFGRRIDDGVFSHPQLQGLTPISGHLGDRFFDER